MTSAFVIDANVVIEWAANEAPTGVGTRAARLVPNCTLHAPSIYWSEARNGILNKGKLDAISEAIRDAALAFVSELPVRLDPVIVSERALSLAVRHGLTVYDSYYVELAARLGISLATNDQAMRRAAEAEGVVLV